MKESQEVLIPLSGCEKHIWGELKNANIGWMLSAMGVLVRDVTPYGLPYYRIHDSYAHLGLAQMSYVPGLDNGREVDIPMLYFTAKGIAIITGAFELLLATADKGMIQVAMERWSRQKDEPVTSAVMIPKFTREFFLAGISNRRA